MPRNGIDVGGLSLSTEASAAERARDLPALEKSGMRTGPVFTVWWFGLVGEYPVLTETLHAYAFPSSGHPLALFFGYYARPRVFYPSRLAGEGLG